MRIALIISMSLLFSLSSYSQSDTSKVEQYCEVVATGRLLSKKVTIDVDYGEQRSMWKDNRLRDDQGKFVKFNSVVDAINYMGKAGWKLVNAFPVTEGNSGNVYHYVFKKEFPIEETNQ